MSIATLLGARSCWGSYVLSVLLCKTTGILGFSRRCLWVRKDDWVLSIFSRICNSWWVEPLCQRGRGPVLYFWAISVLVVYDGITSMDLTCKRCIYELALWALEMVFWSLCEVFDGKPSDSHKIFVSDNMCDRWYITFMYEIYQCEYIGWFDVLINFSWQRTLRHGYPCVSNGSWHFYGKMYFTWCSLKRSECVRIMHVIYCTLVEVCWSL